MKTNVGLWIDHRKAIVVTIAEIGEDIKEILSEVEKQPRRSSGLSLNESYESVQLLADDSLQRVLTGHLNIYYDSIIECISNAESILILGPGEAKNEFKKRLDNSKANSLIVSMETVDRMTNPQIAAKTRQYFSGSHQI